MQRRKGSQFVRQRVPELSSITKRIEAIKSSNRFRKTKDISTSHRIINKSQRKQFFEILRILFNMKTFEDNYKHVLYPLVTEGTVSNPLQ